MGPAGQEALSLGQDCGQSSQAARSQAGHGRDHGRARWLRATRHPPDVSAHGRVCLSHGIGLGGSAHPVSPPQILQPPSVSRRSPGL